MEAIIIVIGNEVVSGCVVDRNSAFLSSELQRLGIRVIKKVIIPDEKDEILKSLHEGTERAELIILTGGLGPTHNDITRKTVSSFLKRRLILNDKLLTKLKEHFAEKGIEMPQVSTSYALVPQGATILDSTIGAAPGFLFEEKFGTIILLPGTPYEMEAIFNKSVLPYLRKKEKKIILSQTIHTTGISEAELYERLKGIKKMENVVFLPLSTGIDIRVIQESDTTENARDELLSITDSIIDKLDDFYYGSDNETLEIVVGILLSMRRKKLAIAESCTAGLLMKRVTDVPGSSNYFVGGVVTYSNEAKIRILKVNKEYIKRKGAVSGKVAERMAEGVRKLLKADYGVSITGIAGPSGEMKEKPIGLVYIGISDETSTISKVYHFTGTRETIREQSAQAGLDLLRKKLLGMEIGNKKK